MNIPVSLIAAVARNNVIGADRTIPWRIPSDFAWFKQMTMGKPMVMGRKQFETFPKPLPGRPHIVVTRQRDYAAPGIIVRHSLAEALQAAREIAVASGTDEIMVIGGGDIYAQALPLADRLYITHVDLEPPGDVHFPAIDPEEWRLTGQPVIPRSEKDGAGYDIRIYERVHGPAH
ncbi:dihydrofolate reductase [Devosia sp. YIM 151766]|uniref:dihydrofolate reductase n=1 Tax=Devosia sp. YIM 151766 TaxID=3017325 RepID=UPI00255CF5B3|nr:dihydrofolate reductase [Devosia sp. YIM 151766]WIY51711.1 dihydrofolate reductase [Devosia sp. YIM 151766]